MGIGHSQKVFRHSIQTKLDFGLIGYCPVLVIADIKEGSENVSILEVRWDNLGHEVSLTDHFKTDSDLMEEILDDWKDKRLCDSFQNFDNLLV